MLLFDILSFRKCFLGCVVSWMIGLGVCVVVLIVLVSKLVIISWKSGGLVYIFGK